MRALAVVGLVLILHAESPARAEVVGAPATNDTSTLPLPPRGTHRLIRIGPQVLLSEDDHGRVKMADEPETVPTVSGGPRQVARGLTAVFGIVGFGAFLFLEGEPGLTLDVGGQTVIR